MKGDAGKWAERKVQEWLDAVSKANSNFAFHRMPDARAARGALASQPSDHLVVYDGVVTFLETKESAEKIRLPKGKISQYGALMKFHWAGANVAVVVHRSHWNDWVVFRNVDLFPEHNDSPASFVFAEVPSYPTAAEALGALFT